MKAFKEFMEYERSKRDLSLGARLIYFLIGGIAGLTFWLIGYSDGKRIQKGRDKAWGKYKKDIELYYDEELDD